MIFGKITANGELERHSIHNPIILKNGSMLVSGDPDVLLPYGYKKVIYTAPPEQEGYYADFTWKETDTEIVQMWELFEIEDDGPQSMEERMIGVENSIDELSMNTANNEETINMLVDCILEMSEIVYA